MSRSRRKLDTSPIEYDDVVDSPALKGMVSFLEVPPGELPRLDFTQSGVPQTESSESGTPIPPLPSLYITPDPDKTGVPQPLPPQRDIPVPRVPEPTSPVSWPPVLSRPLARVRRATLAQDGHSFGEQALYDALWQHAHPRDNDSRIITIGYRRMSELARLTVNNCKANIQALIQKLAVEELSSFTHSQGRTYLVYNYSAIIQRRREAGFTHYIKSRGVVFVDPDTGVALTARVRDRSGIPFSGGPSAARLPEGDGQGTPEPVHPGAPDSSLPPYSQPLSNAFRNSTSSTPQGLIEGLGSIVKPVDDEAVTVLWRQCRKRAEDCTVEEILHFARAKAAILRTGKIQNPVGFLLASVPKCFEGESFAAYRREQAQRAREAEEQSAQMRREFEAILNDPNSSEEDRAFVRRMLQSGL